MLNNVWEVLLEFLTSYLPLTESKIDYISTTLW